MQLVQGVNVSLDEVDPRAVVGRLVDDGDALRDEVAVAGADAAVGRLASALTRSGQ